ncbi:MAG TPA: hypothetical protein VFT98_13190 [Myxococcota bacterium]|nr:hypothetical protein [Myxococcota bacterium]
MTRQIAASLITVAALLAAAPAANARDYRFFEQGDRVYYQPYGSGSYFEKVAPPHFYLPKAVSAFEKGHRSVSAEYLEKAAVGFAYFEERAAGEDKRQLKIAGRALEKLAYSVRRGETELTTLQRAVKDAERVLDGERVASMAAPQS